jgi:oxalate decarboxylase/phosphoglucose isomerase-like protein (cupin superfamily)
LIEIVKDDEEELAIIVRRDSFVDGVKFITPEQFPLQFGLLRYKKGGVARPHMHPNITRTINQTQELIHVEKGKIKLDIFNSRGELYASRILSEGDSAFFISGGRGWVALEEAEIFEVKQGPFMGEKDKIILEAEEWK